MRQKTHVFSQDGISIGNLTRNSLLSLLSFYLLAVTRVISQLVLVGAKAIQWQWQIACLPCSILARGITFATLRSHKTKPILSLARLRLFSITRYGPNIGSQAIRFAARSPRYALRMARNSGRGQLSISASTFEDGLLLA